MMKQFICMLLFWSSHELGADGNLRQCMEFAWQCFFGGGGGYSGVFCELLREASPTFTRANARQLQDRPPAMVVVPLRLCQPTMHRKNNSREMVETVKCLYANMLRRQPVEDKPFIDLFKLVYFMWPMCDYGYNERTQSLSLVYYLC